MANIVLAPLLAEFVLEYPAIALEVDLSARFVDLIGENFDVARSHGGVARRRVARRAPMAVLTVSSTRRPRILRGAARHPSRKR